MANITEFRTRMKNGGVRANHFKCSFNFPTGVTVSSNLLQDISFLCKSSSLPSSDIQPVPVQYRGREVSFAGEKRFNPWTVQIYNDDFAIRYAFEQWSNLIQNNSASGGVQTPNDYIVDLFVEQKDRNDNTLTTYHFKNAFPVNISEIQLDYDAANQIEIFAVTFVYDYWTNVNTAPEYNTNTSTSSILEQAGQAAIKSLTNNVASALVSSVNKALK